MNGHSRLERGSRRRALRVVLAGCVVALLAPVAAVPAGAIDVVATSAMACPVSVPQDIAVLGADTIVAGNAIDDWAPIGAIRLCRIRSDGSAAWTRTLGDVLRTEPVSVAVGSGGIYVSGTGQLQPSLVEYGWVRRFSLDGAAQQSVVISAGMEDTAADIAVGHDGKVYVTGKTDGSLGDNPPQPRTPTMADAFLRAFEADLDVLWTDQFRGMVSHEYDSTLRNGFAWGTAVAADSTGVYLTGLVVGSLPGGPAMRHSEDAFVRRYSTGGTVQWTRQFDATWPDAVDDFHSELQTHSKDIALSSQGVHVVGTSRWLGDRDQGRIYDAFQRVYTRDGSVVWTKEIGGWGDDVARKVFPDSNGSVVLGVAPEGLGEPDGPATHFLARIGTTGAVESIMEFAPDGWLVQGSAAAGDGSVVRFASVVVDDPYSEGTASPDVVPPPGTNLVEFDARPPVVGVPSIRLPVRSTASSTSIPLDAVWTASDGGSTIIASQVEISRNGGEWQSVTVATAASRTARTSGSPGATVRLRVRATDGAGNTSAWAYGPTISLKVVQETSSSIVQTASWRRVALTRGLGGYVDRTTVFGASARYKFSGRTIAWVTAIGPARGRADVYIDGKFVVRINTYAASFASRQIVFQRTWSSAGTHTIELRNRATPGHPRIDLDAFIVFK